MSKFFIPLKLLLILLLTSSFALAQNDWTELSPATTPDPRLDFGYAYNDASNITVIFGGDTGMATSLNDTWTFDGTTWTELATSGTPAARFGHTMVYDSNNAEVVLFGGSIVGPTQQTYTFSGTTWTLESPMTSPSARAYAAMAYDSTNNEVVLFGGLDGGATALNDTWTWNGTDWTQEAPMNSPPVRLWSAMAHDANRGVTVLFGGYENVGPSALSDVWEWDGTNWTEITPATMTGNPTPRYTHRMSYHSDDQEVIVFGGNDGSSLLAETWRWDGSDWAQDSPSTSPDARSDHGQVYDDNTGLTYVFAGLDGMNTLSDTWSYGVVPSPTSSQTPSATPSASPSVSVSASMSATPSATPSASATPSGTPSQIPSATPSRTPSGTPSSTPSVSPSSSISFSPTPSITPSASGTPSSTPSLAPSPSSSSFPPAKPKAGPRFGEITSSVISNVAQPNGGAVITVRFSGTVFDESGVAKLQVAKQNKTDGELDLKFKAVDNFLGSSTANDFFTDFEVKLGAKEKKENLVVYFRAFDANGNQGKREKASIAVTKESSGESGESPSPSPADTQKPIITITDSSAVSTDSTQTVALSVSGQINEPGGLDALYATLMNPTSSNGTRVKSASSVSGIDPSFTLTLTDRLDLDERRFGGGRRYFSLVASDRAGNESDPVFHEVSLEGVNASERWLEVTSLEILSIERLNDKAAVATVRCTINADLPDDISEIKTIDFDLRIWATQVAKKASNGGKDILIKESAKKFSDFQKFGTGPAYTFERSVKLKLSPKLSNFIRLWALVSGKISPKKGQSIEARPSQEIMRAAQFAIPSEPGVIFTPTPSAQ